MRSEPLDEVIYEELYELWRDMYRQSEDRAGAHLRWLGVDPDRLEELAAYVDRRPVEKIPGLRVEEAAYCQRVDADMLREVAAEIREEQEEMEDPW